MKERIRQIVRNHSDVAVGIGSLSDSSDLYSAGMTSHSSVVLMLALENEFAFEFPPDLLNRSVFESVDSIASAIEAIVPEAAHSKQ